MSTGHLNLNSSNLDTKEKSRKSKYSFCFFGPSVEIRTRGLLNPIQARYQTSPHPDIQLHASAPKYSSILPVNCQEEFPELFRFLQPALLLWFSLVIRISFPQKEKLTSFLSKPVNFSWSECRDSNSRPLEPHSSAIPNFATPGYHQFPDDFDMIAYLPPKCKSFFLFF